METSTRLVWNVNQVDFQLDSILKYFFLVVHCHIVHMNETKSELPLDIILHHLRITTT